jgi:cytochrome c553
MIDCLRGLPRPVSFLSGVFASVAMALNTGAWAQAVPVSPASAPQVAAVTVSSMSSRVLACTVCHGKEGRATSDGYFPRIAGKPAGYLANQLLNFRDGRRSYPQMTYLIEHLSDDYLREMAEHFAALDLPYPPPPAPQAQATALEHGRKLAQEGDATRRIPACVSCHGSAMTGVAPSIPGLLGMPRDYLNSQLGAWKTGQRRAQLPDCMADIARQLTPDDVSAVSAWLAAQPVAAGGKPVHSLPAAMPARCGGVAEVPVAAAASGAAR